MASLKGKTPYEIFEFTYVKKISWEQNSKTG